MHGPRISIAITVLTLLCAMVPPKTSRYFAGPATPPSPPVIETLSPQSSHAGAAFTLSVLGANFQPGSVVLLNGKALKTTFVRSTLITAEVQGGALLRAVAITVRNSTPQATLSNARNLQVPCPIALSTPALSQTRARLGVYYFDGWSGPLTKPGFNDLLLTQYHDREPLSGWQDGSACTVEQQLASAHSFGIDFFVFDWYFNPQKNSPEQNPNSALEITHMLSNRHGMQYAIMYVNHEPFSVAPAEWASTVKQWVGYMTDAAYVRVNGKPLFVIYDVALMRKTFGSSEAVARALAQLRAAAVSRGLPGVYVAAGFHPGYDLASPYHSIPDLSTTSSEGYDALTMYGYSVAGRTGLQPFSVLSQIVEWIWGQVAKKSPLPFIPTVRDGWDERPIRSDGLWYSRSPREVAALVRSAINWANAHPSLRPEPPPMPPLVLIEAWNELTEGSFIVPTVGEGTSFGDALATMLKAP